MYATGEQEGVGIFQDIGSWLKGAAKSTNKFLKKTKVLSRVGSAVAPLLALHPATAAASGPVGSAAKFLKQRGYGKPPKAITAQQMRCIREGYGRELKSGAVSLVRAKRRYPKIKNVTPKQMEYVRAGMGRRQRGGGLSLAGGAASGY